MFELTEEEFKNWRSHFVTSKSDKMGLRHRPMAFTEQGVVMLSSVLNSERAIEVNKNLDEIPTLLIKLNRYSGNHRKF